LRQAAHSGDTADECTIGNAFATSSGSLVDSDRLLESSRKHILRGIDAWCENEQDIAVLHCGISVEHLLKAFLASKHPSLLVDARDFSALLHAAGEGAHAAVGEHLAKSIGALECFKRVTQLTALPMTERQAEPIFSARNGVAHLGLHQTDRTDETVVLSVRLNDAILTALGADPLEYWSPYAFREGDELTGPSDLTAARERWKESRRKTDDSQPTQADRNTIVASKLSQARIVLEAYGATSSFKSFCRFPEVKPLDFDDWLRLTSPRVVPSAGRTQSEAYTGYCKKWFREYYSSIDRMEEIVINFLRNLPGYDRPFPAFKPELYDVPSQCESYTDIANQRWVKCPACGFGMAALREQGRTYIGPAEWPEAYEEDYLEVWKVIRPELLDCPVCLLQLDGNDELEVVGLDQAWNDNGPLDYSSASPGN
jgi:hypothetical protein